MGDKDKSKEEQDSLSFNFQDILGDSSSFQAMHNFDNEDNQSASYNNLPAELQHLFSTESTDDLLNESNASSSLQSHALLWNSNDNTPSNASPFVTPSPIPDSSKPSSNSQSVLSNSPMSQNSPQVQPQPSPETSPPQTSGPPAQPSPSMNLQHSPQITAQSPKVTMAGSPQIKAQSPHHGVQLSRSNSQHSPVVQHSPVAAHQSPLSHSQPLPQHSPLLNSQSPRPIPQQISPQTIHSSPQSVSQALPQQSPQQSPQIQQSPQHPPIQQKPQPISQSPNQLHQSPQVSQPPAQNVQGTPTGNPPTPNGGGGATHLTLLDNLTAQLPHDRRESFFRLFRQLQNNEVTANQFLEQAKMLLDQQQYQQLENLKSRPAAAQSASNASTPVSVAAASPRYVRPPIQPQQPAQPIPQQAFKNKRPMSSSQLRAEDTQRGMAGLIAPQNKRSRLSDVPPSPQALPMYRPNPPQQMQHIQMQQQHPPQQQYPQQSLPQSPQQQHQQQLQQMQLHQQQQQMQPQQQIPQSQPQPPQQIQQQQSGGQVNYENYNAVNEEDANATNQSFMNTEMLTDSLNKLASEMDHIEKDVVTFIALAAQARITEMIQHMIYVSKHRVDSQEFVQPPENEGISYKIADIQDVKKQLLALERVEREEERKRKETIAERERRAQMGDGEGGEGGEEDRPSKKKKKKEMGPGVTARYMSEGARKKNTDETALMIAGGIKKSWMLTGIQAKEAAAAMNAARQSSASVPPPSPSMAQSSSTPVSASPTNAFSPFSENAPSPSSSTPAPAPAPPPTPSVANAAAVATNAAAQVQSGAGSPTTPTSTPAPEEQPRGRGRPRRRKSGSGADMLSKKDRSKSTFTNGRSGSDNRFFLPPSTIGRPNRLGEQGTRKVTIRDALYVLEDECVSKRQKPRRTLLKAYAHYLK